MRILASRRLLGPNFHLAGPAAIAEVTFADHEDPADAISLWAAAVGAALGGLGWPLVTSVRRCLDERGRPAADLVFAAPVDALYLAADINDWAIAAATRGFAGVPDDLDEQLPRWRAADARARDPQIAALRAAAADLDLPTLVDDEALSIGHGRRSRSWPLGQLPAPSAVPWSALARVPIALITGTNGKTTTARLLARIACHAGHSPGNTSTDGLAIAERTIAEGDWTGPSAARTVLRHPDVDLAVLEVARGGILRRGLAIDRCDAAAITNISADHLGDYGVHDLQTMARVKATVARVVAPGGRLVLGADSPPLVELVAAGLPLPGPLVWFALRPDHPQVLAHRAAGGEAWFVADGALTRARGADAVALVDVAELPFCFGGAAEHNVANGLAAAALASALGLPDAAIAAGLRSFTSSAADNPGRANLARIDGVLVLLDFAHNAAGIAGLTSLLHALRGPHRLIVCTGVAGDRRDEDIRDAAAAIHALAPTEVRLRDHEKYLRGRRLGDVPEMMRQTLVALGTPDTAIREVTTEIEVLREGLAWARPGDVIAILDHVERDEIHAELQQRGAEFDPQLDLSAR
jgi:cyanophycin synthetase